MSSGDVQQCGSHEYGRVHGGCTQGVYGGYIPGWVVYTSIYQGGSVHQHIPQGVDEPGIPQGVDEPGIPQGVGEPGIPQGVGEPGIPQGVEPHGGVPHGGVPHGGSHCFTLLGRFKAGYGPFIHPFHCWVSCQKGENRA